MALATQIVSKGSEFLTLAIMPTLGLECRKNLLHSIAVKMLMGGVSESSA